MPKRVNRLILLALTATTLAATGGILPVELRCQGHPSPEGVDLPKPRLSWRLESDQRAQSQSAWQVLVASTRAKLDRDIGDLWDSGKVPGEQSRNVIYGGRELRSRSQCFWKVRSWDRKGQPSPWSSPASWGMGILDEAEWKGRWIKSDLELFDFQKELKKLPNHAMEHARDMWKRSRELKKSKATDIREAPAVWLRREFSAPKKVRRATAYVSGLGFYELYLNGSKVGDSYFHTTVYDFGKTVPYLAHDVTEMIRDGGNAIGVILGNGYYNPIIPGALREYTNDFIDTPRLRCELQLEYADGSIRHVVSDEKWRFTTDGPVRFNSLRAGETYDARRELGEWSAHGYDDKEWKPALAASAPAGTMRNQEIPPLRIIREIPAVSVKKHDECTRFDIGVQCTGWARLKLRGKPGQKITISYPGTDQHTIGRYQTCEYICKGGGDETSTQRFSFNGYQFIDVHGLDYEPQPEDLVGLQVVSDLEPAGTFSCSDEKLNALQEVHLRTVRNYNVQLPMDPVREKSCWTQDVQSNFECSAYNYNLHTMYRKWQHDFLDAIQPNGYVPCVVPGAFDGPTINGPWWGGMIIFNPWQLYNFYGDKDILARSYEAMKRYLAYLDSIAEDHLVSWGLGDWLDVAAQQSPYAQPVSTTVPYTSTCAYFHYADILRQTAELLGKPGEAARYHEKREAIRKALHEKFFDPDTGVYDKGSQTAYVLALRLKISPEDERGRTLENFRKQIARDNDHLSCGFVGMPFLLTELTEQGEGDLAWKIATQDDYPGWYDMIFNHNNTVFMEAWNAENLDSPRFVQMPSLAASIGTWFYRSLGGIRPDEPGFKTFIIEPYTDTLDWVKCTHKCPYGTIHSNWSRKDGVLAMELSIPVNTTATVFIPGGSITESGKPAKNAPGVTFLRQDRGRSVFRVTSGVYLFKSAM